jgi:hypothetical protein
VVHRCGDRPHGLIQTSRRESSDGKLSTRKASTNSLKNKLDIRFSNRPVGVKRFQTIHRYSVDVTRRLVLPFGIGTEALPSWDSRTRRNNLLGGLAVRRTRVQADMEYFLRGLSETAPPRCSEFWGCVTINNCEYAQCGGNDQNNAEQCGPHDEAPRGAGAPATTRTLN